MGEQDAVARWILVHVMAMVEAGLIEPVDERAGETIYRLAPPS